MATLSSSVLRNDGLGRLSTVAREHWPAALVFFVALVFYLLTLSPTIFDGVDSIEFSTIAYRLGIPHPPGYPLYLVLGKLFTFLPVGDVGYRINLMSAVFAAGTAVLVFKIALMVTQRQLPALAAALFFAFSYYAWRLAVVAEVYTLQAFLTALIIYLWFRWEAGGSRKLLYAAAFALGLSLGNHMTIGLLGLAFAYLVGRGVLKRALDLRSVALMGALFIFGAALIYAYLPWRYLADASPTVVGTFDGNGVFNRVDLTSASGLWWMLSGQEYDHLLFAYDVRGFFGELGGYFKLLNGNFLGIGIFLGVLGMLRSAFTRPHQFIVLFLVFAANVFFFANYGAFDKETMYLPTYVIWAIWTAWGLAYLVEVIAGHHSVERIIPARFRGQGMKRIPWQYGLLLLPVAALIVNFSYADVSSQDRVQEQYREFLTSVEPNAMIVAWYLDVWPMVYLQEVEDMRPDVFVVDRFRISRENEVTLIGQTQSQRPVYIFGWLPAMHFPHNPVLVWQGKHDSVHKIVTPPPGG